MADIHTYPVLRHLRGSSTAYVQHARNGRVFQDVVVQTTQTYRIAEPDRAATRIDFGIDLAGGRWRGTPLEQLASMLTELAQQHALELLAATPLAAALVEAPRLLRSR